MHKPIPSSFKVDIFEAFDMDLGTMRPGPSYWRGAIRQVIDHLRNQLSQTLRVRVTAQKINVASRDGDIREAQLPRLPRERAVAVRAARFDDLGDVTHGRQKWR